MALIDNLIGMIIVIFLFLVGGLLLMHYYSESTSEKVRFHAQLELEERHSNTLNALLEVSEPKTGRSLGELLGSAIYFRNKEIQTRDGQIDIEEEVETLLARFYPGEDVFLTIRAPIKASELIFVIDGSESVDADARSLAEEMPDILRYLNDSFLFNVTARVYILSNSTLCDSFSVPCENINHTFFYFSETYTIWDLKKARYELLPPPHFRYSEKVWRSDWETAVSALMLNETNEDLGVLKIFLPLTDSLTSATKYLYPCPKDYAVYILARDKELLRERNFIIDPILISSVDPILYCENDVLRNMDVLISEQNGVIIRMRENLGLRLQKAIEENLESASISIGEEHEGEQVSIERKIPMPSGDLATVRLQVPVR